MWKDTVAYRCNPELNTECRKTGCFINGGECHATVEKKYAAIGENGQPLVQFFWPKEVDIDVGEGEPESST